MKSEKDLGVLVCGNFSWNDQAHAIYSKATSRFGLLKRTLHFVKCPKQKRAFYLAIVRSQFEHCLQVWRPTTSTLTEKLEKIQMRAIKWILSENDHHYNDLEYMNRLRDLDLLPIEYRFILSDLIIYYNIYNNKSCVKLPEYYHPVTDEDRSKLRKNIKPPDYLEANEILDLGQLRKTKSNEFSLKCIKDVNSNIFKNCFFFRTLQEWNRIPTEIRSAKNVTIFKENLRNYLKGRAFTILEPD